MIYTSGVMIFLINKVFDFELVFIRNVIIVELLFDYFKANVVIHPSTKTSFQFKGYITREKVCDHDVEIF